MEQGRRVVFPRPREVQWETFDLPERLGPSEILVKARKTLVSSGTEVAIYAGRHAHSNRPGATYPRFPLNPGYTFAGEVLAVGEKVSEFAPGDRAVTVIDARHATHAVVDTGKRQVARILEPLSDEAALLASLSTIALGGIRLAHLEMGERAAVFGAGLIGLFAMQYAHIAGAGLTITVDLLPARLDVAQACGADYAVNAAEVSVEAHLQELAGPSGPEVVVEATGSPQVTSTCLKVAADLVGRVILLGSPRGNAELDLYTDLHRKGIAVIGAHGRTHPAQATIFTPWTWLGDLHLAMLYAAQGRLRTDGLISHRLPAGECLGIWDELADHSDKYLGVILDWSD